MVSLYSTIKIKVRCVCVYIVKTQQYLLVLYWISAILDTTTNVADVGPR